MLPLQLLLLLPTQVISPVGREPNADLQPRAARSFLTAFIAADMAAASDGLRILSAELHLAAGTASRGSETKGSLTNGQNDLMALAAYCGELAAFLGGGGGGLSIDTIFTLFLNLHEHGGRTTFVSSREMLKVANLLLETIASEGRHSQHAGLARYTMAHCHCALGQYKKAERAISTALTSLSAETAESAIVLGSALHSLRAQISIRQDRREAALGICRQLAELSLDMNAVYRCALGILPLRFPAMTDMIDGPIHGGSSDFEYSARFSPTELYQLFNQLINETKLGQSSPLNLHKWDMEQWNGFGTRVDHFTSTADDSLDLVCDLVKSHKVASDRMLMPRLLIVMPVVPSEHKRLVNNLREWQQNRSFPCGDPANSDRFGVATFMLLFSRSEMEAPHWLTTGHTQLEILQELLGPASACFGDRLLIRWANLTNEEEFYQGGWVATGPNNLFYPLMTDVRLQEEFDMAFWMETDAVPIASGWLERLFEEARTPRGLWRKGPSQLPLQHPAYLGVVGPHLYHMNAVGFYRIGDPCYVEFLRRVRLSYRIEPFDVSQHRFLHDRRNFRIFQRWAHKFVYTDAVQNWVGEWSTTDAASISPNTVIVHGKNRKDV